MPRRGIELPPTHHYCRCLRPSSLMKKKWPACRSGPCCCMSDRMRPLPLCPLQPPPPSSPARDVRAEGTEGAPPASPNSLAPAVPAAPSAPQRRRPPRRPSRTKPHSDTSSLTSTYFGGSARKVSSNLSCSGSWEGEERAGVEWRRFLHRDVEQEEGASGSSVRSAAQQPRTRRCTGALRAVPRPCAGVVRAEGVRNSRTRCRTGAAGPPETRFAEFKKLRSDPPRVPPLSPSAPGSTAEMYAG